MNGWDVSETVRHPLEATNRINALDREVADLRKSLAALVEQFEAYRNDWLDECVWRDRIGLPDDLERAKSPHQQNSSQE